MEFLSILGAGLAYLIGGFLIILLVATIIFRAATKLVIKQDTTFGMSIGIVLLGAIASIMAGIPASVVFGLVGAPEIFVSILSFIISFSATSGVYMFVLKTNFWKASLIQIVMLLIVLLIVVLFAILFGGLAATI